MHAQDDRDQFAPPRPPARVRAIALAVLAHVLLVVALTWGVNWKTHTDQPAVQAELWSAVPQQAAPRAEPEPQPEPPPTPPQPPEPVPAPPPPPPPPPRQAEPDPREAEIALEKKRIEKEKKDKERAQQLEREKRERERKEEERRAQEKERLQKEKEKEKLREKERLEKQEKDKRLAEEKKQKDAEDKRKQEAKQEAIEKANAKAAEARRQENLRRMQGLAGATGGENATGTAKQDSGPSGSYGGRVAAKVKPHIVYPDAVSGNPRAEVEVRAAPDGTITGFKLIQSSGNKAWDEAVLRALQKTETLPRDVDGRVPSSLVIGFRPKD